MKKRVICILLSALFAVSLLAGCQNDPGTVTGAPDTEQTAQDTIDTQEVTEAAEFIPATPSSYKLTSDVKLAGYDTEGTVSYNSKTVEFIDTKTSINTFALYQSAVANGNTVTFPASTVAGIYPLLTASETEKNVYKFDLACAAPPRTDAPWFTFYFGLRLDSEGQDPTQHTGVWLAMRNTQIGMRKGAWPNTNYVSCDFDFSNGGTVIIVDDPESNVITVYGGSEDNELARIVIDGKKLSMYAPGSDKPAITDTVNSDIRKGGYVHLWNHHTEIDVTVKNVFASLVEKTYVKQDINGIKPNTKDIFSDTWTAYDDVGRTAAYSETDPNGKKVGMFYFLWHEDNNNGNTLYDHTASYESGGRKELEKVIRQGSEGYAHYWGEPYFGYYCSNDEWVIRKHGAMLSEAGIDFVYFDATNGPLYKKNYEAVMRVWSKMRQEGLKTPDVCFILKNDDANELNSIWRDLYSVGLYEDMWFRWQGKPVIMFTGKGYKLSDEQKDFFTVRISWATESGDWYADEGGIGCWPWASMYKQKPGIRKDGGTRVIEQMAVMCGFWANGSFGTNAGRSYTKATGEPRNKSEGAWDYGFGLYPQTSGLGLAYQECFDFAIQKDPELIMITGWNEWWAGRWDILGQTLALEYTSNDSNKSMYVDNFNPEFSRDLEPMKGGFGDNYYYQTVINVRKYKGSRQQETAFGQTAIELNGDDTQWFTVGPEYRDVYGDTAKRDHVSYAGGLRYKNDTGRNDILTAKVSSDGDHLYFFVECADAITERQGDNWMNLFIKSDDNDENGWYGFDYVINRSGSNGKASIERFKDGWSFEKAGEAEYVLDGKTLKIKVKKSDIGYTGTGFDFKWADNSTPNGDIMEFMDNGDAAPDGRFCFRYTTTENEAKTPDCLTADMAVFKANGYNAYINGKQVMLGASTNTVLLASGYDFYLPKATLASLGISCDGETEYDHYGVTYVKANDAVEKSGKAVTVTSYGLLVISKEKITDTAVLDTLYRSLY